MAIIGCSAEPYRTSYGIARQMQRKGYKIIPVNPNYQLVLGEKCYEAMSSIPKETRIDIVVIFRNKIYTEQMVEAVVKWAEMAEQKPVIWTQLDVSSPGAEMLAKENNLPYVKNYCIAVEYAKHMG